MAEEEVRIPIVVTDEAAADAQLRRLLSTVEDLTRAVSAQAAALEGQSQAQAQAREEATRAAQAAKRHREEAAEAARQQREEKEKLRQAEVLARAEAEKVRKAEALVKAEAAQHADILKKLEKAYYAALTPSQKTAVQLAELHRLDLTAIKDAEARAEAERMRASAIAQTTIKMEDQARREKANRGRSLSMLFDEQNKLLSMLPGRLGEYTRAAADAVQAVKGIASAGEAGSASILAMVGTFGAMVSIGATVTGILYDLQTGFYDAANEIDRVARGSAISTEELSRYQVAAKRYGFDLREFADIHGNLAEKMQRAIVKGGDEERLFKALGISVTNADGSLRKIGDVFLDITDKLSYMRNQTDALAVANNLFGEDSAKKVVPAIMSQAGAFRSAAEEADKLGLSLSGDNLDAAREYKRAGDELALAWQGAKKRLAETLGVSELWQKVQINLADELGGVAIATREAGESGWDFYHRVKQLTEQEELAAEIAKLNSEENNTLTQTLAELTKAEKDAAAAKTRSNAAAREAERLAEARARRLKAEAEAAGGRLGKTLAEGEQMLAVARVELARDTAEELDRISEELMQAEMDRIDRRIAAEVAHAEQVKASRARLVDDSIMLATQLADGTAVILERMGKDQSKAAVAAFRVQQALSVAQITIDAVRAAAGVYADFPGGPGVRAVAAGVAFAAVEAMALKVAAEKPPQVAHMGGVSRAGTSATRPGEVPATLEQGEVVVSASQARAMGGPEQTLAAIRAATSGRGASQTVIVYDGRTISRAVRDDLATGGQLYRATRGAQRVGLVR